MRTRPTRPRAASESEGHVSEASFFFCQSLPMPDSIVSFAQMNFATIGFEGDWRS